MILSCLKFLLLSVPLVLLLALGQSGQDRGHEVQSVPLGKVSVGTLSVSRLLISITVSGITSLFGSEETTERKTEKRENEGT